MNPGPTAPTVPVARATGRPAGAPAPRGDRADPLASLAAWDRDEAGLSASLSEVLGRPVRLAGGMVDPTAESLFTPFDREPLAAFSRTGDGGITLPGNPHALYRAIVEERWLARRLPPHARLPATPPLPGPVRQALAGWLAPTSGTAHDACPPHPAWPADPRVDRFRLGLHRELLAMGQGPTALPRPAPWPHGRRFAFVVTHDLDTLNGQALAGGVLEEEAALGLVPSFFLPARGYRWDEGFLSAVRVAGGEVGLHGLSHDPRLPFAAEPAIRRALEGVQGLCDRHAITGFRAPFLLDTEALVRVVGERFAYDTSCPDTDTRSAVAARRGCGTLFPCRRFGTLTVPVTLPQDDRLLQLGYRGLDLLDVLRRKVETVRALGGVALVNTHPEPHLGGRRLMRDLYLALFREVVDSGEAWITTPGQVARFWASLDRMTRGATAGVAP